MERERRRRERDLLRYYSDPRRRAANRERYRRRMMPTRLRSAADSFACVGAPSPLALCAAPKPVRVSLWTPEYKLQRDRERRARIAAERRVFTAGRCGECEAPFAAAGRQHRFCSARCAARSQRRIGKHARDKRLRGRPVEKIGLLSLARRDNWTCHLCRHKVSRKTWSIDHLIPVSQGGSHTWANVALAHHRCNTLRGATGIAQLRLVG